MKTKKIIMRKWNRFSSFTKRMIITVTILSAFALPIYAALSSAVTVERTQLWLFIDADECLGCGTCVDNSPCNAFYIADDGKAAFCTKLDSIDEDCAQVAVDGCPVEAIRFVRQNSDDRSNQNDRQIPVSIR